jgi:CubicO group peptidase (beta-lactamase class C family)
MTAMPQFNEAISFAQSHEIPWPRDPAADPALWGVHHEDPPPFNRLRGPVHPRGGVSGVIHVRGEEVAAWGEPDRADQTFSVAKTYLALLAGIAHARGLLEPQRARRASGCRALASIQSHNRAITWEHLLTQTSEWQGECFGMPDQVEHYRRASYDPKPPVGVKGELRPLREPGSYWEYNDVRINQLSLALLNLFRRPLPEVFIESVLQPIGGGRDFRWEGYDDAWVEIDGQRMQSVPGGTHWGGGVSISARDQARIGQLLLDGGAHQGRQIIPRDWVERMHTPLRSGTVLWLAHLAQSRRAAVRRCVARGLVHVRRGWPPGVDRPGLRRGGCCTLARRRAFDRIRALRGARARRKPSTVVRSAALAPRIETSGFIATP